MKTSDLTRRQILAAGMAGMAAVVAPRMSLGASDPAAAGGMLSLGGDLNVNRMGFGAMRLTGDGIWGEPKDPAQARAVLRRAVELGVDFIDTADAYGPNVSEELIAAALYPYPRGLVIATKGGMTRAGPGQWNRDGRPEHLRAACEASLKRLKLERIDLYQLHAVDTNVPLEDSIGELARLQKEGKVRHVGVSNFKVDELARAQRIVPIVSVQNRYNASDRTSQSMLDACTRQKLAFIPWAPIASGSVSKLQTENDSKGLQAVAQARGISVFQVAIAWLLAQSPAMLPIPGTSSVEHLQENVAAAAIKLTPAEISAIG
jgi:aryl-alcohol dehydrogenase-like predicted oxidoreductase